jgi:hypoxanthine phosphoribosyltransferase
MIAQVNGELTSRSYIADKPIDAPEIVQWLDEKNAAAVKGKRVLIVDEVDDSRATLL